MILYIAIAIIFLFVLIIAATYQPNQIIVSQENRFIDRKIPYDKILFCLVVVFLWFLTAFRSRNIGNDTIPYLNYFVRIKQSGVNKNYAIELGYQYYCLILGKITQNENAILIVTATICYLGVGFYALKYSDNLMFSLLLLFCICFSMFTNILRQNIAMVICLYAYQCLKNKKYIWFVLFVLFASTFHTSALVVFVLFFNRLLPKNIYVLFLIAVILIFLSATNIISNLLRRVLTEYDSYFDGQYANSGWLAVTYSLLRASVFVIIVFSSYRGELGGNRLIITNFVMLLFMSCLGYSVNLFTRASEYFLMVSIVELPNAVMRFSVKRRKLLTFITGFVMLTYFFVTIIFRPEWNHLYPYEFWMN